MSDTALTIVIPVYNEGENIERVFQEIEAALTFPHTKLVVYDFDGDDTVPVVQRVQARYAGVQLLKNTLGPGVVNALRAGFAAAAPGAVVVVMGDLSDSIKTVHAMRAKIAEGYDLVCGSRYIPGGRQIGGPRLKGFLSRMAGKSLHALAGIPTHDVSNAFKMYRTELLHDIEIESTGGFEVSLEILVKAWARGYRITEVPSTWRDRTAGASRFRLWRWLPKYLRWYLYALRHRPKNRGSDQSRP